MSCTVVICYLKGTSPMLEVCLESIKRHTNPLPTRTVILYTEGDDGLSRLAAANEWIEPIQVDIGTPAPISSRAHGAMLDVFIPEKIDTDYFLTLDSDCFPVADGWLEQLEEWVGEGHALAGILHPWAPPPDELLEKMVEWRVRSQHCWKSTHVACQMLKTDDYRDLQRNRVCFNGGDDTGLLIPDEVRRRGWPVRGFKATRCPKPEVQEGAETLDPEFNRYSCLIYGDMVYHHGGYTRESMGDKRVFEDSIKWVLPRLLGEKGVEFLLQDRLSYQFHFGCEEEVSAEKMDRLFGLKGKSK